MSVWVWKVNLGGDRWSKLTLTANSGCKKLPLRFIFETFLNRESILLGEEDETWVEITVTAPEV